MIERRHRVLAPTLAGHLSGTPLAVAPDHVVPFLVDDVEQTMSDTGMETAHIVGNSLGGWVALELARRGRARSVVALSPAGAWRRPRDLLRLRVLFAVGGAMGSHPVVRRLLTATPMVQRAALRRVSERPERMSAGEVDDMLDDLAGCAVLPDLLRG
ncbi:MAG: alpha/beta fold hydrolase, partial [Actinomycetota bacterium]|nr:alpha/beta fold hydrolase [Actinomycetota bacterium]